MYTYLSTYVSPFNLLGDDVVASITEESQESYRHEPIRDIVDELVLPEPSLATDKTQTVARVSDSVARAALGQEQLPPSSPVAAGEKARAAQGQEQLPPSLPVAAGEKVRAAQGQDQLPPSSPVAAGEKARAAQGQEQLPPSSPVAAERKARTAQGQDQLPPSSPVIQDTEVHQDEQLSTNLTDDDSSHTVYTSPHIYTENDSPDTVYTPPHIHTEDSSNISPPALTYTHADDTLIEQTDLSTEPDTIEEPYIDSFIDSKGHNSDEL